ncbi:MAG: APC family permease [Beutenbergiaceae bacterium]
MNQSQRDHDVSVDAPAAVPTAGKLAGGKLGVASIVFFVVSAAAPLSVIASGAPFSIRLGGIGAPGAIVVCGIVLILFAAGFTAMSKYVRNAGAFYAYVTRGLGSDMGNGVAVMVTGAYALALISFYGVLGFFTQLTMADVFGIDLPWGVWSLIALVIVTVLGHRQVDLGARVLAVLLTAEVAILLALSLAIVIQGGPEPFSAAPFSPQSVFFAAGAGSLFVLGFGSYLGFEGTAIYAEEAVKPERTIPTATYVAIGFLAVFYGFTYWTVVTAFGVDGILAIAQSDNFGDMVFLATEDYLGQWAAVTMRVLIVTSFLACLIAFHNACARYLFAMGRAGLLPARLGRTHKSTHSPYVASAFLSCLAALALVVTIALGGDPYLQLGIWTYSAGVVGIVVAQLVCAIAVIAFFARDRKGHTFARVQLAPALGALGMGIGVTLIVSNFEVITGTTGVANWLMMAPTPLLFVVGIVAGRVRTVRARQAQ